MLSGRCLNPRKSDPQGAGREKRISSYGVDGQDSERPACIERRTGLTMQQVIPCFHGRT